MMMRGRTATLCAAAILSLCSASLGQGLAVPTARVPEPAVPLTAEAAAELAKGGLSPQERETLRIWNKKRIEAEKVIKTIRFKHFGTKAVPEIRQAGLSALRQVTEPAAFPSMIELLRDEQVDVLTGLVDHLHDLDTDQSLATLAYAAVYEKRDELRALAAQRLADRVNAGRQVPDGVHTVIASGLASKSHLWRGDAARLAVSLKLIEAIPAMIAGQISAAGGGGSAGGYIAWIAIGQQRAYVADLEPVVGDGSVAFDPVPGVVTDGVVLAINDAVVVQYHVGVHDALVGYTSKLSGEDTSKLGWNPAKWKKWYETVLLPKLAKPQEPGKPDPARPATAAPAKRRAPVRAV